MFLEMSDMPLGSAVWVAHWIIIQDVECPQFIRATATISSPTSLLGSVHADDKKPLVNASCFRKWITPSARDSQQIIFHFSGKLLPELDCHTSRWWTVFELRTAIRINKSSLSAGRKHTVQELPTVGTASDQRSNISLRMTSDTVTPSHISPTHISIASPSCFWLLSLSFSLFATSLAKDLWTLEKAVGWAQ